jgi:uncharacterized protein YjbI with pentapeptide repeats
MTTDQTATEAPAAEPTYRPFLDVILQTAGNPTLPDGYDTWGFKITRPDLRTYKHSGSDPRFRWPWPGGTVTDPKTVVDGEACPTTQTGGYCVALTLNGARSGGYGHATILLLAYRIADVAGEDTVYGKRRVSHCMVVDVIAGQDAYRLAKGADLAGANLTRAYLADANLTRANLAGADLTRADLTGADLTRAYLTDADLAGADLTRAYLAGAYLTRAYLTRAYLGGADLTDAYLTRAYLTGADLTRAYLAGADLTRADLTRAYLADADLTRADLTRANLAGAYLTDADLTGADLGGAYLTRANLTRANLTRANLRKSQLSDVQLSQIIGTPAWMAEDE